MTNKKFFDGQEDFFLEILGQINRKSADMTIVSALAGLEQQTNARLEALESAGKADGEPGKYCVLIFCPYEGYSIGEPFDSAEAARKNAIENGYLDYKIVKVIEFPTAAPIATAKDPDAQYLPDGFWEAVDVMLGYGFEWVAFDDCGGAPALFIEKPVFSKGNWEVFKNGHPTERPFAIGLSGMGNKLWSESERTLTRRPFLRIGQTESDE